jgi:hypothetical protein
MCVLAERRMRRSEDVSHATRLGSRMRDPFKSPALCYMLESRQAGSL